jgi:Calcineurin-like phosphoesterase
MPRNAPLSILQSALDRYLTEYRRTELLTEIVADEERRDMKTPVASYRLHIADEDIPPLQDSDRRMLGSFQITDLRWVSSLVAMGVGELRGRKDFPSNPAPTQELRSDARVVVVGDWASGIERARKVAKEMRAKIDETLAAGRQCHVIHLGDTYYAGWAYEYRKRFLPHWPVTAAEADRIGSWSLPGNHDMYTGGNGFYNVLLKDDRFDPYHRGSSRFTLENEDWQLLGLDTSWKDHELACDQAAWVERKLAEKNDGRRTMLLSHHQPFSAYNDSGGKLYDALKGPLGANRIDAWLWGHEHRCAVYRRRPDLAFPCCIGHGGVPVYAPERRPPAVKWHLDRAFREGLEVWAFFGFAVLDFDGPEITFSYVNEDGETDHQETIS